MTGRRVPDGTEPSEYQAGDYGRWKGEWWAQSPANAAGHSFLGCLRLHTVVEHDDGTISVTPSILIKQPTVGIYHGYLEHGTWTACCEVYS